MNTSDSEPGISSPISPWSDSAERVSPDGKYLAEIKEAWEIAMGGPTSGTLIVRDNKRGGRVYARLECCSPSFVWSSDSRALAVPQWSENRQQRLCIVSIPERQTHSFPGEFSVLELHSFGQGTVRAVDSPRTLEFHVTDLLEKAS